jgi:hypothetical protein
MKAIKKPIAVDVWQLDFANIRFAPDWVKEARQMNRIAYRRKGGYWTIHTIEGPMFADNGDYLIKGVKGELYPCREDIFEETYDVVEGER